MSADWDSIWVFMFETCTALIGRYKHESNRFKVFISFFLQGFKLFTCCFLCLGTPAPVPRAACTAGLLAICCASLRFCWDDWADANICARTSCAEGGGGRIFCICVNLHRKGGTYFQSGFLKSFFFYLFLFIKHLCVYTYFCTRHY